MTEPTEAEPSLSPPFYKRWWFWTGSVVAAGLLAGGGYLGVKAMELHESWEETYVEDYREWGKKARLLADVLLWTGAATAAATIIGAIVVGRGRPERRERVQVTPSVGPGQVGVAVTGSF